MLNLLKIKIDLVALFIIIAILLSGLTPPFINFTVYESENGYFRMLDIFYILFGLLILLHFIISHKSINRYWISLIIITGIITIINCFYNDQIIVMAITWLSFILTTTILIYEPNSNEIKYILYVILLVSIANILLGLLILIGGDYVVKTLAPNYYLSHSVTQPFCIIGGPIILAFLCLITMVVSSLLWRDKFPKALALSNTFLLLLSVIWASRSGFLAVLAAYIIMYWRGYKKFVFLPVAIALMAAVIFNSTYVREESRFTIWDFSDNSSLLRYTAAVYVVDKLKENYWLGTGPGIIFNRGDREKFADIITQGNVPLMVREGYLMPTEPHNTYLLFFLEYGLPGIVIFIVFIINALKKSKGFNQHFNDNDFYQLAFIIIFLVYGLTESLMYNLRFAILLWSSLTILHIKEDRKIQYNMQYNIKWS